MIEEDMDQFPQYVIERNMDLLDDEGIVRGHRQSIVHGGILIDESARATRQSERQQPHVLGDFEPASHIWASWFCGKPQGHILGTRQVLELIGKHLIPALMVRDMAERRGIVGERNGWEGTLSDNDGVDKLDGNVLGIGTADAIAKGDERAALMKAPRHVMAHACHGFGLVDQGECRLLSMLDGVMHRPRG